MNNYKQISQELINSYQAGDISIIAVVAGITHFGNIAYEELKQKKLNFIKQFIEQYTVKICEELGVTQVWFDNQVSKSLQNTTCIELVIGDVCRALFDETLAGKNPTSELVMWYFGLKENLKKLVESTTYYQDLDELQEEYSRKEEEFAENFIQLEDDPQFQLAFEKMESLNEEVSKIASTIIKENPSLPVESAFQQALEVVLQTRNIDIPFVREILTSLSGVSIQMKNIGKSFDVLGTLLETIPNN